MANETGGRADKFGNKFEKNCIINYYIDVVREKIKYCSFEKIGDDEKGTDIIIEDFKNVKTLIQCKERNIDINSWSLSKLSSKDILKNWLFHLNRDESYLVGLQTPLSSVQLEDLIKCAKNTDTPDNFYTKQVKSSKQREKDFNIFCSSMNLKLNDDYNSLEADKNIIKAIDYLRRIKIIQTADENLKEEIITKIESFFLTDENIVYNTFLDLIENGNIMAKNVDRNYLFKIFEKNNITLRTLENDKLSLPNIDRLNKQFKNQYVFINNELIFREEIADSIKEIQNGKSLIICGTAGIGKSSCIKGIIDYLEKEDILYLAIKLDIKTPKENEKNWSKMLGFEFCISDCLDKFSNGKKTVLIFDQLDALRWTQSHSRDAIDVCQEIIDKINRLNEVRENKISIIFTCRTYDLETDTSIKYLLKDTSQANSKGIQWKRIILKPLDETILENIIGENWILYNYKLKSLLKIPSNLFIWTNINKNNMDFNIYSTGMLIEKWWEQIEKDFFNKNITSTDLKGCINNIIKKMVFSNKNSVLKSRLDIDINTLNYLCSQHFIVNNDEVIMFAHQSILDYYIAKDMVNEYCSGTSIIEIIGDKSKQIPSKRYQFQMFLEEINIFDGSQAFIEVIRSVLESNQIRSYLKFVCYEVLSQIDHIDDNIFNYVSNNLNDNMVNTVLKGHISYISKFIEKGVFDKWIYDDNKLKLVSNLLKSVYTNFTDIEIEFIKNSIGVSKKIDLELYNSLDYEIEDEDQRIFDIRLQLYKKYPELYNLYVDVSKVLLKNEKRVIDILEYLIKYQVPDNNRIYCNFNVEDYKTLLFQEDEYIIDKLLPLLSKEKYNEIRLHDWENNRFNNANIRRIIINVIKKANSNLIKKDVSKFYEKYKEYFNKGYLLHNEIILAGFLEMTNKYANEILLYVFSNIENNAFEYTSGNIQKITYTKQILKKFISYLSIEEISKIEQYIVEYKPCDIIESYKYKNHINKNSGYQEKCYISFYGDFQLELLKEFPQEMLNIKTLNFLNVLKRKFYHEKSLKYNNNFMKSGNVISVLSGKVISDKQWIRLFSKKRSNNNGYHEIFEKGIFISSELNDLLSSFSDNVKQNPNRFINIALQNKNNILKEYILNLYSALAYSDNLNSVSNELIENVLFSFPIEDEYERSAYFCRIIAKKKDTKWSENVIKTLKNIYNLIKNDKIRNERLIRQNEEDDTDIVTIALNSAIGDFSEALENLLWTEKSLFSDFKSIIMDMIESTKNITNYCCINILKPCLNIDKEWSIKKIIQLCKSNHIVLYNYDIRNILNWCYCNDLNCRTNIQDIIENINKYRDGEFKKNIGHLVVDLYILYDYKSKHLHSIGNNKLLYEGITEMLICYYQNNKYKVKPLLLEINRVDDTYNHFIGRIFYDNLIDIKEDKDFLIQLVTSPYTKNIVSPFLHYINENNINLIEFKQPIILLSKNTLEHDTDSYDSEYNINELIKTVIKLYDEVSNKSNENDTKESCMDIWDLMFENGIGNIREISKNIINI